MADLFFILCFIILLVYSCCVWKLKVVLGVVRCIDCLTCMDGSVVELLNHISYSHLLKPNLGFLLSTEIEKSSGLS